MRPLNYKTPLLLIAAYLISRSVSEYFMNGFISLKETIIGLVTFLFFVLLAKLITKDKH